MRRRPFAMTLGGEQEVPAIEVMRQARYDTAVCVQIGGRLLPVTKKHVAGLCGFWRWNGERPIDKDPDKTLKVRVLCGVPDYMQGRIVPHPDAITIELIGD